MNRVKLLITAGPTHEPIDAVRFVGNRSSGRVGIALSEEAGRRNWDVTLLLGPTSILPQGSSVKVLRFRTAADLQGLLKAHAPDADILIMAAAVADYRPKVDPNSLAGKIRRKSDTLTLELEPTPDLLAEVASTRRPNQFMVGFALEPRDEVLSSALAKLQRKKVDMVVGNPLETMDSATIEATVVDQTGTPTRTPAQMPKDEFASWLLDLIDRARGPK